MGSLTMTALTSQISRIIEWAKIKYIEFADAG